MPILSNRWPDSSNSSEACSSAFEGMQPTLRQVPPKVFSFSTTATFRPSWAARMAQTYPPGPEPITMRSNVSLMVRRSLGEVIHSRASPVVTVGLEVQQQAARVFDAFLDADQEGDRFLAVHDAVIVGQSEVHHRADLDLAADDHRTLLDLVHPED